MERRRAGTVLSVRAPPKPTNTSASIPICGPLMTFASRGGSRPAELVPKLAVAAPEVSSGGRVYTFRVRPGYRFSPPSGRPVTAAAFERAIERVLDRGTDSGGASFVHDVVGAAAYRAGRAETVSGVTARGDQLTVRLTRPSPTLPARLASSYFCAVPPDTPIRPRGLERVATAGPYSVAAAAPGKRLVLRRNPGYPGPRPRLDAIEVTIGTPAKRAVADVEAGRADYVDEVPPAARARLIARYGPGSRAAATGRQRYFAGPVASVGGLMFNPARPLFAKAAMRRAVNYALDRRALARVNGERPTDQLMPPGWPGFRDAAIYPLGGPDVARARRLAGGERRHGVLYTCNVALCVEWAQIVRENLAAIGIELEVRRFGSFGEMFARAQAPGEPFDLSVWGWLGDFPDPAQYADDMFKYFRPSMFIYRTGLGPQIRAASRLTGTPRIAAYAALDREITAREAPFAPIASEVHSDFFSARIGCQVEHPLYGIDLAALCVRD